jgi:hypothetical protein
MCPLLAAYLLEARLMITCKHITPLRHRSPRGTPAALARELHAGATCRRGPPPSRPAETKPREYRLLTRTPAYIVHSHHYPNSLISPLYVGLESRGGF